MSALKKVCSVSGGQTSAYLAANYEWDALVFALVQIEDKRCAPKDKGLIRAVEAKIGREFIATGEEDGTLTAVLDLEQYIGKNIDWVTGPTFDEVVSGTHGGWLPNMLHRYCTIEMKIRPIFRWWHKNFFPQPVEMGIGFRANEQRRALKLIDGLNQNGLSEIKETVKKHANGRNKWEVFGWRRPIFPLIEDGILKNEIQTFWEGKPIHWGAMNNCVGCFHRNPMLLNKQAQLHPEKFRWFVEAEENNKFGSTWRSDVTYRQVLNYRPQLEFDFDDFSECDSGFCGM